MSSTPRPGALLLQPSPLIPGLRELSPLREASLPLANGGSPPKSSPKKDSPLADSPPIVVNEPALSLVTPPRDVPNMSKMMLKTPSPPTDIPDIPDLPDIPSSDGSEQSTPVMSSNMTIMNTPKPPGAWMQTPAPALRSGRARSNTLPANTSNIVSTPLPVQRGNSFPMRTPAPPGAWNATPGFESLDRKSTLKVRFDVTSESETTSSGQQDVSLESIEMVHPSGEDPPPPTTNVSNKADGIGYDEPRSAFSSFSSSDTSGTEDDPRTPVIKPSSVLSRTPSVRVVDAFGREVVEENQGKQVGDVSPMTLPAQDPTPSRKPPVRIVDAMGREVRQSGDATKIDTVGEELSKAESLAKMRESISSLAKEMDDIDSSLSSDDDSDEARLRELDEVSAKAQETRGKLKQALHSVQSGEEDWKAKYGSLRASMRKSISFVSFSRKNRIRVGILKGDAALRNPRSSTLSFPHQWDCNWSDCPCANRVHTVHAAVGLREHPLPRYWRTNLLPCDRLSHMRAQQLFLSTYYDPLFPDLYLHVTHPEKFIQSLENPTPPWSIYHVPDAWVRAGWTGVLSEFTGNVTLRVAEWQRQLQELATTYTRTDMPWPPQ